jgi:hypothetical protein
MKPSRQDSRGRQKQSLYKQVISTYHLSSQESNPASNHQHASTHFQP